MVDPRIRQAMAIKEAIDRNESEAASVFGLGFGYLLGGLTVLIFTTLTLPWPIAGPGIFFAIFASMVSSLYNHYKETQRLRAELVHLLGGMSSPPTM